MILMNLIALVVCTIVALICLVARNQVGFIACTLAGAANGWIVYTHFTGVG